MDTRARAARLWRWYVLGGIAIQAIGAVIIYAAVTHTNQVGELDRSTPAIVAGAIIGLLGLWGFVFGLVMLGVAVALGAPLFQPADPPTRPHKPLRPAQNDPAELAHDPDPFAPHAGDSEIVAQVRHGLTSGRRPAAVRRRLAKAGRNKPLTESDAAMAEALIAESSRRSLGPLPPQF